MHSVDVPMLGQRLLGLTPRRVEVGGGLGGEGGTSVLERVTEFDPCEDVFLAERLVARGEGTDGLIDPLGRVQRLPQCSALLLGTGGDEPTLLSQRADRPIAVETCEPLLLERVISRDEVVQADLATAKPARVEGLCAHRGCSPLIEIAPLLPGLAEVGRTRC